MSEKDATARESAAGEQTNDAASEEEPLADRGDQAATGGDELAALRAQAEENWNRYLRSVAELENLRKRASRELENARKFGAERLISAILPVRDSLEAGLKAASEADQDALEIASLLEGERATLRLLDQALADAGITEIDPEGQPFDPERHEAMSLLPSTSAEPNSVLEVVQKGYALHERIIRPARVVVASEPADSDSAANP